MNNKKKPLYVRNYLERAEKDPLEPFRSTHGQNMARHLEEYLSSFYKCEVEIKVHYRNDDKNDPDRKVAYMAFEKEDMYAGNPRTTRSLIKIDVSTAVFLAKKIIQGRFGMPYLGTFGNSLHLMMMDRREWRAVRVADFVRKQIYPDMKRHYVYVDGNITNLCNWNIYPKPYHSFFDQFRWDGYNWYVKLRTTLREHIIKAHTEEDLVLLLMEAYKKNRDLEFNPSPSEKTSFMFGRQLKLEEYTRILSNLRRWSPTKNLDPYTISYRAREGLWLPGESDTAKSRGLD